MIDKKIAIELGIRLKQARKAIGYKNRNELSGLLGIHPSTYGLYERGKRVPGAVFLKKFCDTLSVNYTWLFTGYGSMYMSGNPMGLETKLLEKIFIELDGYLKASTISLERTKKARIVSVLYEDALENQQEPFRLDRKTKRFIKLLANR